MAESLVKKEAVREEKHNDSQEKKINEPASPAATTPAPQPATPAPQPNSASALIAGASVTTPPSAPQPTTPPAITTPPTATTPTTEKKNEFVE